MYIEYEAPKIQHEFFIDTYYAYDWSRPKNFERSYTTQPARHSEFNINLLHFSSAIEAEKIRANLTLQHGTSVVKNYVDEPRIGATSGPIDARNLQQAYVGVKLAENLWADMGIYLGHIGMESWISKDNWTYTRSLLLDYVPYYQAGVRFSFTPTTSHAFGAHIMNGWQNISSYNEDKAVGLSYTFSPKSWKISYNNYYGPMPNGQTRLYQNIYFVKEWETISIKGSFDVGYQKHYWYATALILRKNLAPKNFMAIRGEFYNDPREINAAKIYSNSINYDYHITFATTLRFEIRQYKYYNNKIENSTTGIFSLSNTF